MICSPDRLLGSNSATGVLNYLDKSVLSSLFCNGQVRTIRYPDGGESPMIGVITQEKEMTTHNALEVQEVEGLCHVNGFEPFDTPLDAPDRWSIEVMCIMI